MALEIDVRLFPPRAVSTRGPPASFAPRPSGFRSATTFVNRRSGRTANAKSTLALVATLTRHGDPCALRVEGDDEAAAEALGRFVRDDLPTLRRGSPGCSARPRGRPRRSRARSRPRGNASFAPSRSAAGSRGDAPSSVESIAAFSDSSSEEAISAEEEIAKLDRAFARTTGALEARSARAANETERAILAAHLSILDDPSSGRGSRTRFASNGVAAVARRPRDRRALRRHPPGLREATPSRRGPSTSVTSRDSSSAFSPATPQTRR